MKPDIKQMIEDSINVQRTLVAHIATVEIIADHIIDALRAGHKVLACGNGGSAADAEHLVTELVGRFLVERPGYPALALSANTSQMTALANDYGFEAVFARQVQALAQAGDVLIGFTTSGNSPNVLRAVEAAKERGVYTIGMTGQAGGQLKTLADICLCVASQHTPRIQEAHTLIVHGVCALVENALSQASMN